MKENLKTTLLLLGIPCLIFGYAFSQGMDYAYGYKRPDPEAKRCYLQIDYMRDRFVRTHVWGWFAQEDMEEIKKANKHATSIEFQCQKRHK